MSLLPIVRLGHPALRMPANPLAAERLGDPATQELVDDMIETMRGAHGVGLAAPQVGMPLQIFVYEVRAGRPSDPEADPDADLAADPDPEAAPRELVVPLRVVINPMLTPQAGELMYDWEGCLSLPDLRGLVPRHPAVRVRGLDRHGQPLDYLAKGFEARIIQHEHDHLNGVVFLDRMRDLKSLAYLEEWEQFMMGGAAGAGSGLISPIAPPAPDTASVTTERS